ncbi:MAG TPA: hypothetical protein IAA61_03990 [Candidatus Ornithomonoglobus merdipullorum]|uniref:Replicative helicase inhibitor G39P N-terminal domain-containing protein n=1 Tax=Candidatus Ornithomonoglobus merdipullorum TaxID=2840895 RepID=A0A9D1SEB0_9FIRM|nr:hypothetical protein [Candidatus Ornithomonoglobus merdipullorum]
MTINEAVTVVEHLCAVYPVKYDVKKKKALAAVWAALFHDTPAADVWQTVLDHIGEDTAGCIPVPGKIKDRLAKTRKEHEAEETQEMFLQRWSGDIPEE